MPWKPRTKKPKVKKPVVKPKVRKPRKNKIPSILRVPKGIIPYKKRHTFYYENTWTIAGDSTYASVWSTLSVNLNDPEYTTITGGKNAAVDYFSLFMGTTEGKYGSYIINDCIFDIDVNNQSDDSDMMLAVQAGKDTAATKNFRDYGASVISGFTNCMTRRLVNEKATSRGTARIKCHIEPYKIYQIDKKSWNNDIGYRTTYNATSPSPVYINIGLTQTRDGVVSANTFVVRCKMQFNCILFDPVINTT